MKHVLRIIGYINIMSLMKTVLKCTTFFKRPATHVNLDGMAFLVFETFLSPFGAGGNVSKASFKKAAILCISYLHLHLA